MIGTVRWNFILAFTGFLLTFILSAGDNFLVRALINSFYSFIILFMIGFAARWLLGTAAGLKTANSVEQGDSFDVIPDVEDPRGAAFDAATPEDGSLNEMIKEQLGAEQTSEFVPLTPRKLASAPHEDGEQLAQALRRLTE